MNVSDKKKIYDCLKCPYPLYKDSNTIFCDVCIKKILDEQKEKSKERTMLMNKEKRYIDSYKEDMKI